MLYVDNLQHGLNTNPFSLPRCAFLDMSIIDSIAKMDRMRDVSSETVEFGKLMVRTHTLLAHIPLFFLYSFQLSLQLHWRQSCYLCTYIIAICSPIIHQLVNFYIVFYKKKFGSWGACLTHATMSLLLRHQQLLSLQHQLLPAGGLAPLMPLAVMPLPTRSHHPCTGTLVSAVLSAKALLM